MASKTLHLYAYGLQSPLNHPSCFESNFPSFGVISFRAKGHAKASIQYVFRLAFGYAQTDQGNLVDSAAWVEVKSGDVTSISGGPGQKRFGESAQALVHIPTLAHKNRAGANSSSGFVSGDGIAQRYEPTLVWTDVGSKSNITAQFTPTLTAYVTRDYKATEMIRGDVETAIWSCNLNELGDVTGWNFTEDAASGEFSIERANKV
ncbi:hypothetical protein CTheo_4770 [Ceratobasidium theobromae]|uniref:Uncharacterized protein n=1 Tax=Ceratobasidium theobromae TaxID=1582974 RepID=A0A5N5QJW1_9AGAM|nr:hypothetical protein CTheo_4770 [Ceratobasidium theobromae]